MLHALIYMGRDISFHSVINIRASDAFLALFKLHADVVFSMNYFMPSLRFDWKGWIAIIGHAFHSALDESSKRQYFTSTIYLICPFPTSALIRSLCRRHFHIFSKEDSKCYRVLLFIAAARFTLFGFAQIILFAPLWVLINILYTRHYTLPLTSPHLG